MSSHHDLPFTCEYAKSGRAGCKGCKTNIAQGSLRIGIMVQSPHFDGKVPTWHHQACFWKKARIQNIGDLHGYDSLRWEDQEALKKKIEEAGSGVSGVLKNPGSEDFSIEYAKSNRATCRSCQTKIQKGEIRVSVKDYESKAGAMRGGVEAWRHLACFSQEVEQLEFTDKPDKIFGFNTLSAEDQKLVNERVIPMKKRKAPGEKSKASGDSEDGVPPKKQKMNSKAESKEETKLKEQSKAYWEVRDQLERTAFKKDMAEVLEINEQDVPAGESKILDCLTDVMLFGPLKRCKECQNGQLVYSSSANAYVCTGHISAFTKCQFKTQEPERTKKFQLPEDFDHAYLTSFKFKPGKKRLFPSNRPAPTVTADSLEDSQSGSQNGGVSPDGKKQARWLDGLKFVIAGNGFQESRQKLTDSLRILGGEIVTTVTAKVHAVISTQSEAEEEGKTASAGVKKILKQAKKMDIHVVDEGFLDSVKKGGVELMIKQHSIVPWGTDDLKDKIEKAKAKKSAKSAPKKSEFTKSVPRSQKLTLKGGVAVDPECEVADSCHVYKGTNGDVYTVTLNMVDIQRGNNSYYKLQLLEHDKQKSYYVFRAWGRIGTTVGGNKCESFGSSYGEAKEHFKGLYLDKTGNGWEERKSSGKQPGKFYPVEVDYGDEEEESKPKKSKVAEGSKSKLHKSVQEIVRLIFDVEQMKQTMKEFEIDLKKMPLGKLSKKQIQEAYKVLGDLQKLMNEGKSSETKILDASNQFYTMIPHDFGMQKPKMLDNDQIIKEKTDMLDSLLEIEVAYSILQTSGDEERDPLDEHYEKLKTDLQVLDKEAEEFKRLEEYVKNTHGKTHTAYKLHVQDIFKVEREGEAGVYEKHRGLKNRMLLWHGSRVSNYAGILSQGLRIAPPEAPVTGYMFGKGIYFADMVTKSANYCHASPGNTTGLMMLCEVALGDMWEHKNAKFVDKLPAGKHSTKGVGMTMPDPKGTYVTEDGVIIPMGQGINSPTGQTSLLYNEFIVYDVAQVRIKYLLKMDFKYNY